jgi:ABC-type transport system involved in cytochrome bd biosynthesis fused ATPase/permease subunit
VFRSGFRSGDLLARLISDVDATQDLFIRVVTPVLAAALVGGGAVTVCLLILAPAAAVLAAGLLAAGIVVPLAGTAVARRAARAGAPARGRLAAVTDTPDPVREPCRPRPLPPGPCTVRLRDATVRYESVGLPALDRVSLDLPPGRRVALVGANGADKSTVAAVLMRFCELSGGAASLDGHDLASYAADDVRNPTGSTRSTRSWSSTRGGSSRRAATSNSRLHHPAQALPANSPRWGMPPVAPIGIMGRGGPCGSGHITGTSHGCVRVGGRDVCEYRSRA